MTDNRNRTPERGTHSNFSLDDVFGSAGSLLESNPLLDDDNDEIEQPDEELPKVDESEPDLFNEVLEPSDDEELPELDPDADYSSGDFDYIPLVDASTKGDVVFEPDLTDDGESNISEYRDDAEPYIPDDSTIEGDSLDDILSQSDAANSEPDSTGGRNPEPTGTVDPEPSSGPRRPEAGDPKPSSRSDDDGSDAVESIIQSFDSQYTRRLEQQEEEDELSGFNIDRVISDAIKKGASDIHISSDSEVAYTILGDIVRQPQFGTVTHTIAQRVYKRITTNVAQSSFATQLELDAAYVVKTGPDKGRRLRLSVGFSFSSIFMVFRVISDIIPTPEELGVRDQIKEWTTLQNGLILICGPTGTGKSTTFASLIRRIQMERPQKIITIEKPIEYVYGTRGKAFITQREVGTDCRTFSSALTSAMRQNPNIILVGEVRNREEVDELLRASETGHLAMSTMHTNSPSATITRIMSLYQGDEQLRVLGSLRGNLRGIANQVLLKSADGKSRFAVQAVLNVDDEIAEYIGQGDADAIERYMRNRGTSMEHELLKVVKEGRCTYDEARSKTPSPSYFDQLAPEIL